MRLSQPALKLILDKDYIYIKEKKPISHVTAHSASVLDPCHQFHFQ